MTKTEEIQKLRFALQKIEAKGVDLRRYNNMKSFPVALVIGKKLTNIASEALGRDIMFKEPEVIGAK